MTNQELAAVSRILREFQKIDAAITLQACEAFLTVVQHEGLSVGDLAKRLGICHSGASHAVSTISSFGRRGKAGYGLIEPRPDPRDRRFRGVYLTQKGRLFAQSLSDTVSDIQQINERKRGAA